MIVAAGALIFFGGELLILKPTYRDYWLLPGGHVESGESPRKACAREVREETGLNLKVGGLLCVDFWRQGTRVETDGRSYEQQGDSLTFLFSGGSLDQEQVRHIVLQEEEIEAFQFLLVEEALSLLALYNSERIRQAMQAMASHRTVYLEEGRPVPSGHE